MKKEEEEEEESEEKRKRTWVLNLDKERRSLFLGLYMPILPSCLCKEAWYSQFSIEVAIVSVNAEVVRFAQHS